jgi:Leucine-rich repeat (LRR) protein
MITRRVTAIGLFVIAISTLQWACDKSVKPDYSIKPDSTRFVTVDDALKYPERAFTLDIIHDTATRLPIDKLKLLPKLRTLIWNEGNITIIDSSIAELVTLEVLLINRNNVRIEYVAPEVFSMPRLSELALDGANLTRFPTILPDTTLRYLFLISNMIGVVPNEIAELSNLRVLELDHNRIVRLPENICNMEHLTTLSLYDNQISVLPDSIGKLVKLKDLNLIGNPISKRELDRLHAVLPNCVIGHD